MVCGANLKVELAQKDQVGCGIRLTSSRFLARPQVTNEFDQRPNYVLSSGSYIWKASGGEQSSYFFSKGPTTQYLRSLVPTSINSTVFWSRDLTGY